VVLTPPQLPLPLSTPPPPPPPPTTKFDAVEGF